MAGDTPDQVSLLQAKERAFQTEDRSLLAPHLKSLITQRVFERLPPWYSANQLTLSGGVCALLVPLGIWLASVEIATGAMTGRMILVGSAVLLIAYAVFDQLDGMQARRLGTSSSFGDFIDHWVDTSIANLAPVPIMIMLGVSHLAILGMLISIALAFWSANREVRETNTRILPLIGGLESISVGATMLIITALFGVDIWRASIASVPILLVVYVLTIPWLWLVVIKTGIKAPGRAFITEMMALVVTLLPWAGWLLWVTPDKTDNLVRNLAFVCFGLTSTLMTGALMRQHWLGARYRAFHIGYFSLGGCFVVLEWMPVSSFEQTLGATLITLVLITLLIQQGLDTYFRSEKNRS